MMHDYFNFFFSLSLTRVKREGVQTHKARLIVNPALHTVNNDNDDGSTSKLIFDCMIFFILFALLFNFFKR